MRRGRPGTSFARGLASAIGLVACATLGASCAPGARPLRWNVEFATQAERDRTGAVVARVLVGGCAGTTLYDARIRPGDAMTPAVPLLDPGRYGLAAFAVDRACALVATDCREVVVPTEGAITLLLSAPSGSASCPADVCAPGGCSTRDGGAPDSGDMGRGDGASRVDAGADAAMDSDLRDAGPGDVGARDSGQDAAAPDAAVRDTGQDAVVCATTAPRVTGSFVASPWFGRVDGAGSAITFVTSGGPMGSLALTGGVTVTGSAVATELCTATCSPLSFRGVTASDHTLTFRDWRDVTSTLTLVGATATGGLELMGSDGYLVSVVGSAGTITFSNGATPPLTGTISLVPETSCR